MSIAVECGCGRAFRVAEEHAGKRIKCPACAGAVRVPNPGADLIAKIDVMEPKNIFTPNPDAPAPKRPFWKDPVIVIGAAGPTLVLALFCGYLYRERARQELQARVSVRKANADTLFQEGKSAPAYEIYREVASFAESIDPSDTQSLANIASAAKAVARLKPQVDAARAEAAAAEKKRSDAKKETDRLAALPCRLEGTAWVELKGGDVRPVRGVEIKVLRRSLSRQEAAPLLARLKDLLEGMSALLPAFANGEKEKEKARELGQQYLDAAEKLADYAKSHDEVPTHGLYLAVRSMLSGKSMQNILADKEWPEVMKVAAVATAETDIDGKYKIKSIPGGHYYIWSLYSREKSMAEWMASLDLVTPGTHTFDLHNNKADLILNEQ